MPRKDGTGPGGMGPGGSRGQGRGQGQGGKGGGLGPGGNCVCPICGHREPHKRGTPCFDLKCPKCGNAMIRG
jgi:hypothetical protein